MRIKFFIFFLIAITTISGLFFVVLRNMENAIVQEKKELFTNITEFLSDKIDRFLHNRITDLISLAAEDQNIEQLAHINNAIASGKESGVSQTVHGITIYPGLQNDIEKYLSINQDFISLEILDIHGNVLAY